MKISSDPAKREATLKDRGINFDDAKSVLSGRVLTVEERRRDYGEVRSLPDGRLSWGPDGDGGLDRARRVRPRHVDEKV